MTRNANIVQDPGGRSLITPERHQHDTIEYQETMMAGATRGWVSTYSALHRYHRRHLLSATKEEGARLFNAGEEYARAAYAAGLAPLPKIGMLERIDCGQGDPMTSAMQRRKIISADEAIGPMHASCIRSVCVEDWSADAWARARGYLRNGTGLAYLRDGLTLLADHWRL